MASPGVGLASPPPLVDALFLTEFDIGRGTTLRHAIPGLPRGIPPSALASLQVPEGAHKRDAEGTVFIIYPSATRDGAWYTSLESAVAAGGAGGGAGAGAGVAADAGAEAAKDDDGVTAAAPGKLRLVCINVVRTHLNAGRVRGADVKALALASRHPWVDTLAPLLAACLDVYYARPCEATLHHLLAELNTLPVGTMASHTRLQRAVLRGTLPLHSKSLTFVRPPPLRALCGLTRPLAGGGDADTGRESLESHLFWTHRALLQLWPGSGEEGEAGATPGTGGATPPALAATVGPTEVHLRVPLFSEPGTFHSTSLACLLRRYGEGIMTIYNAILLEKRILFLGARDVPAGEVCNAVLACAHLVCPPLADISYRLFPSASLDDLSFKDVRGYIAGVTNPIFESKRSWWDVLCIVGPEDCDGKPLIALAPPRTQPSAGAAGAPAPAPAVPPALTPAAAAALAAALAAAPPSTVPGSLVHVVQPELPAPPRPAAPSPDAASTAAGEAAPALAAEGGAEGDVGAAAAPAPAPGDSGAAPAALPAEGAAAAGEPPAAAAAATGAAGGAAAPVAAAAAPAATAPAATAGATGAGGLLKAFTSAWTTGGGGDGAAPSGGATPKPAGGAGGAAAGPAKSSAQLAAEAAARQSRIVLAVPTILTATGIAAVADAPPTPAGTVPNLPPLAVPWKEADHAFYLRTRSGLKFGEHWVRHAFENYTTALTHLASVQARLESADAADVPVSNAQAAAVGQNAHRLMCIRSSHAYSAFADARAVEEAAITAGAAASGHPRVDCTEIRRICRMMRVAGLLSGTAATHLDVELFELDAVRLVPHPAAVSLGAALSALTLPTGVSPEVVSALDALLPAGTPGGGPTAPIVPAMPPLPVAGIPPFAGRDAVDRAALYHGGARGDGAGASAGTAAAAAAGAGGGAGEALRHPPAARVLADLVALLGTPDAQLYFLAQHPDSSGGLHGLALGVMHGDPLVRATTMSLLDTFRHHPWLPVRQAANALNFAIPLSEARHTGLAAAAAATAS